MKFIVVYCDSEATHLKCYSEQFDSHVSALKFIKEFIYGSEHREILRFFVGEPLVIPFKEELENSPLFRK